MTPSKVVRMRHSIDLRDVTVGYLAGRGRSVAEIAEACEMSNTDVRAALRRADHFEGRVTTWCATPTCQSYARGASHADAMDRAFAAKWRHCTRTARLLCPRCAC